MFEVSSATNVPVACMTAGISRPTDLPTVIETGASALAFAFSPPRAPRSFSACELPQPKQRRARTADEEF
jgi:hypothetical protein